MYIWICDFKSKKKNQQKPKIVYVQNRVSKENIFEKEQKCIYNVFHNKYQNRTSPDQETQN